MDDDTHPTCHVHGNELLPDSVRVDPGIPCFTEEHHAAWIALFPHAEDIALARDSETESVVVLYCPACRDAKAEWLTSQK